MPFTLPSLPYAADALAPHRCGFGSDFNNIVQAVGFLNDTLYLGCSDTVDGVFVNNLARWIGGSFIDTCSAPMSVSEINYENLLVKIYPNPSENNFTISLSENSNYSFEIYNSIGKIFSQGFFRNQTEINSSSWQSGMYFIRVTDRENTWNEKIIKQ
jgi:hypothetical protein